MSLTDNGPRVLNAVSLAAGADGCTSRTVVVVEENPPSRAAPPRASAAPSPAEAATPAPTKMRMRPATSILIASGC